LGSTWWIAMITSSVYLRKQSSTEHLVGVRPAQLIWPYSFQSGNRGINAFASAWFTAKPSISRVTKRTFQLLRMQRSDGSSPISHSEILALVGSFLLRPLPPCTRAPPKQRHLERKTLDL